SSLRVDTAAPIDTLCPAAGMTRTSRLAHDQHIDSGVVDRSRSCPSSTCPEDPVDAVPYGSRCYEQEERLSQFGPVCGRRERGYDAQDRCSDEQCLHGRQRDDHGGAHQIRDGVHDCVRHHPLSSDPGDEAAGNTDSYGPDYCRFPHWVKTRIEDLDLLSVIGNPAELPQENDQQTDTDNDRSDGGG